MGPSPRGPRAWEHASVSDLRLERCSGCRIREFNRVFHKDKLWKLDDKMGSYTVHRMTDEAVNLFRDVERRNSMDLWELRSLHSPWHREKKNYTSDPFIKEILEKTQNFGDAARLNRSKKASTIENPDGRDRDKPLGGLQSHPQQVRALQFILDPSRQPPTSKVGVLKDFSTSLKQVRESMVSKQDTSVFSRLSVPRGDAIEEGKAKRLWASLSAVNAVSLASRTCQSFSRIADDVEDQPEVESERDPLETSFCILPSQRPEYNPLDIKTLVASRFFSRCITEGRRTGAYRQANSVPPPGDRRPRPRQRHLALKRLMHEYVARETAKIYGEEPDRTPVRDAELLLVRPSEELREVPPVNLGRRLEKQRKEQELKRAQLLLRGKLFTQDEKKAKERDLKAKIDRAERRVLKMEEEMSKSNGRLEGFVDPIFKPPKEEHLEEGGGLSVHKGHNTLTKADTTVPPAERGTRREDLAEEDLRAAPTLAEDEYSSDENSLSVGNPEEIQFPPHARSSSLVVASPDPVGEEGIGKEMGPLNFNFYPVEESSRSDGDEEVLLSVGDPSEDL